MVIDSRWTIFYRRRLEGRDGYKVVVKPVGNSWRNAHEVRKEYGSRYDIVCVYHGSLDAV